MVFPVVGGNESKGYEISNSLRFNDNDSARLSITPSTTQTSNKIGTLSYWVKRSTLGTAQFPWHFYPNRSGHSNDRTFQAFDTSNRLTLKEFSMVQLNLDLEQIVYLGMLVLGII